MKRKEIERLFKQYYAKMYRVARTILYDEQECKDVVSDIFEHLLGADFVPRANEEEQYLMVSVRNRCFKRLRHEEVKRQFENEYQDDVDDTDDRMTDIIEFVVSHLTPQEQHIFQLRFAEGYSYEEIATQECISKVAVWKHIAHITNEIKKHFTPHTL